MPKAGDSLLANRPFPAMMGTLCLGAFFTAIEFFYDMKLISWNVNGLRASMEKGLREYLLESDAEIIALQEVKAEAHQCDLQWLPGYRAHWNSAQKKGYSGTLILTRQDVLGWTAGIALPEHDAEGRVVTVELGEFYVVNVYTPNSQEFLRRLDYRQLWDEEFLLYLRRLQMIKPVLACGDFNVAHQEIDLTNPKGNKRTAGFSDEERAGFGRILEAGFVDTFREFDQRPGQYSWWSYMRHARANNIGWRIDYWLASRELMPRVKTSRIRPDIYGSDHCPVELEVE